MGKVLLILAGIISLGTGLAHLSCIGLGPECYQAQMAPEVIVQSALDGGWLAPLGTIVVSGIFFVWAAYGISAARVIRPLPWLTPVVFLIGGLCIVRGILGLQLGWRFPPRVDEVSMMASAVWLLTGLCFTLGMRCQRRLAVTAKFTTGSDHR